MMEETRRTSSTLPNTTASAAASQNLQQVNCRCLIFFSTFSPHYSLCPRTNDQGSFLFWRRTSDSFSGVACIQIYRSVLGVRTVKPRNYIWHSPYACGVACTNFPQHPSLSLPLTSAKSGRTFTTADWQNVPLHHCAKISFSRHIG